MRKTTVIDDVARECGLSKSTVSQVLGNGTRPVNAATRERVLEAARRLQFHPNAAARNLARQRTNTIGLVFLHSEHTMHTGASFGPMLDGIMEAATRTRQDTLMCTSYAWADGEGHLSPLLDRRCDGLILVVPALSHQVIPILKDHQVPFVILGGQSDDPSVTTVDTDNVSSACSLIRYLFDGGHTRVAFASVSAQEASSFVRDRFRGYLRAHTECGRMVIPELTEFTQGSRREQVLSWMKLPPDRRPTAIFGVSDSVALEVVDILQREGWRVPDDISVVGYDDIPIAGRVSPGLTTIRQPLKAIGSRCVEELLEIVNKTAPAGRKTLLPTELIIRGSVGRPADSAP